MLDPSESIAHELMTLLRGLKDLHTVVVPEGGPTLERPAFVMLVRIAEAGQLRPSALADCLYVDVSTVSRQLVALENAGWVTRERDPQDRRACLLRVTAEGQHVLQRNHEARRKILDSVLSSWSEADRESFASALHRFNEALQNRRQPVHAQPVPAADGTRQESTR